MLKLLMVCCSLVLTFVQGQDNPFKPQPLHPGPWVEMTHGEIWPRPKFQQSESKFFVLDAENFKFQVSRYLDNVPIIVNLFLPRRCTDLT